MHKTIDDLPIFLKPSETAALLRTTEGTLNVSRATGRLGLPFIKRGRSVLYRRDDVLKFLERNTVTPGTTD